MHSFLTSIYIIYYIFISSIEDSNPVFYSNLNFNLSNILPNLRGSHESISSSIHSQVGGLLKDKSKKAGVKYRMKENRSKVN